MHSLNIDVSFRAVKIFAHLSSEGNASWFDSSTDFNAISDEIVSGFK
jgi:hypothetical protein